MKVRVDGPYGEETARPKWANHEVLIIFAGGIGVWLITRTHLCLGIDMQSLQCCMLSTDFRAWQV